MLAVHAARPGFTSAGFARSGSYDALASRVAPGARVLDLACGDGALLARLPGAIGVDLSRAELARAHGDVILSRAQALPFAASSFDVVTCHLAFMVFDDVERVVAELDRVLRPGGSVLAVLGGGPVAAPAPDDAFPIFLELLAGSAEPPVIGDPRARSEAGWQLLFPGWELPAWERLELVLDGDFEALWSFFAASYELPADPCPLRTALAQRIASPSRCRAVTWLARATKRPSTR